MTLPPAPQPDLPPSFEVARAALKALADNVAYDGDSDDALDIDFCLAEAESRLSWLSAENARLTEERDRLQDHLDNQNDEVMLGIDKIAVIACLQEWGDALERGEVYERPSGGLLLNAADMMINLAQHLKAARAARSSPPPEAGDPND